MLEASKTKEKSQKMKKLLIALSVILLTTLVGCKEDKSTLLPVEVNVNTAKAHTVIIDSCEYIKWNYGFTHKGNCKFCEERRKKEYEAFLENIIIELF